jgi:two-component SAPR family response regulator
MYLLHLEDDFLLQNLFKQVFQKIIKPSSVLSLEQTESSDEAWKFIQTNSTVIRLCVFDIRVVGRWNGVELAEHMDSHGIHLPILFTSAYSVPHRPIMKSCGWISKPWTIESLAHVIRELVDSP